MMTIEMANKLRWTLASFAWQWPSFVVLLPLLLGHLRQGQGALRSGDLGFEGLGFGV